MATRKQIEANQRNALKSTGPTTLEGRRKVSRNALKHGLFADFPLLPEFGETQEMWEAFTVRTIHELRPAGAIERQLTLRLCQLFWRLARISRADSAITSTVVSTIEMPASSTIEREPIPNNCRFVPLPSNASNQAKLARCRRYLFDAQRRVEGAERNHAQFRDISLLPPDQILDHDMISLLTATVGAMGWSYEAAMDKYEEIRESIRIADGEDAVPRRDGDQISPQFRSCDLLRILARMAADENLTQEDILARMLHQFEQAIIRARKDVEKNQSDECRIVADYDAERQQKMAIATIVPDPQMEGVMRMESHVMLHIERTCKQLEQLQRRRGERGNEMAAIFTNLTDLAFNRKPVGAGETLSGEIGFVPQIGGV